MANMLTPEEYSSRAMKQLEEYVRNDRKIIMDTSSVMSERFEGFLANLLPLLEKYDSYIIVPAQVPLELQKHYDNRDDDPVKAAIASKRLYSLMQLHKADRLMIRAETDINNTFADNTLLTMLLKYRLQHKLLLITQDGDLAWDVMNLNRSLSVQCPAIHVRKITKYGYLGNAVDLKQDSATLGALSRSKSSKASPPDIPFNVPAGPTIQCSLCGKKYPESTCTNGICNTCLATGERYNCSRCGKEMLFSNYQKYVKKGKRFDTCKECHTFLQSAITMLKCEDCGEPFTVTNGENELFAQKGWPLPKRCKLCRERRKTEQAHTPARETMVPTPPPTAATETPKITIRSINVPPAVKTTATPPVLNTSGNRTTSTPQPQAPTKRSFWQNLFHPEKTT